MPAMRPAIRGHLVREQAILNEAVSKRVSPPVETHNKTPGFRSRRLPLAKVL